MYYQGGMTLQIVIHKSKFSQTDEARRGEMLT